MPQGIILAKWDDEIGFGALLEAQFPLEESFQISVEDLITIYTFHSMGGLKSGFMMITREDLNVASYFYNLKDEISDNYYLSLILTKNEKASEYQEILTQYANLILPLIKKQKFKNIELKLANFYSNILLILIKRLLTLEKNSQKKILENNQIISNLNNKIEELNIQITQIRQLNNILPNERQNNLLNNNVKLTQELKKKDLRIKELKNYVNRLKLIEEKLNNEISNLRTKIIDLKVM